MGGSISDTATVSGGNPGSGTVTFTLYITTPTAARRCTPAPAELSGSTTASSGSYTTSATGTDYWVATYSGDSNNNTATSGMSAEPVTVSPPGAPS